MRMISSSPVSRMLSTSAWMMAKFRVPKLVSNPSAIVFGSTDGVQRATSSCGRHRPPHAVPPPRPGSPAAGLWHQRRAAQQPAATDRRDDQVQIGHVLEQFEHGGPLPGDDPVIVVRMHQRGAGLGDRPGRRSLSRSANVGSQNVICPPKCRTACTFCGRAVEGMTMYAGNAAPSPPRETEPPHGCPRNG